MNYSQGSLAIRGGTGSGSGHDDVSSTKEALRARGFYADSEEYHHEPRWWEVKHWGKKVWIGIGIAVAIIIAIAVPVGITVDRERNRYPNYTKLNYTLAETYTPQNFFSKFNYFRDIDPSNGFVHYADSEWAGRYNLTPTTANSAFLKVDTSLGTDDASTGRLSVRISSKTTYNKGLFIFDVKHSPYGCGTWPALWLVDDSHWPEHGEIDVLEHTNKQTANGMTLHTSYGCAMSVKRLMTGTSASGDCHNTTNGNEGCRVDGPAGSAGDALNAKGGAVMALEWRSEGIRMWQFERGRMPADLVAQKPDPSAWGMALADFPSTDCDVGARFRNASITANIDLCGAAMMHGEYEAAGCPANCVGSHKCVGNDAVRNNCTDFVASNPSAFANAYWEFGNFHVYQSP